MGRGLLLGLIWGAFASVFGLSLVSLMGPPPQETTQPAPATPPEPPVEAGPSATPQAAPAVTAPALAAPQAAETGPRRPDMDGAAPAIAEAAPEAPRPLEPPPAETLPPLAEAAPALSPATTLSQPPAGGAAGMPPETPAAVPQETPPAETETAARPPGERQPVPQPGSQPEPQPEPQAGMVEVPYGTEFTREGPDLSPRLPEGDAAPEGTAAAPDAVPGAEPPGEELALRSAEPAPRPQAQPTAPEGLAEPATPAETAATALPATEPAPALPAAPPPMAGAAAAEGPALPQVAAAPRSGPAPEPAAGAPAEPLPAAPPAALAPADPAPAATPPAAAPAAPESAPPAELPPSAAAPIPQPGFTSSPGVRILRPGNDPATVPAAPAPPAGALDRYAASFTAPSDTALISVVLVDSGLATGGVDLATLKSLPFPVTFALDPTRPGAAEAARAYRAAGFEVAILASAIPPGATPSDIEVSWQGFQTALPEAIAVLDGPEARVQNDRRLASQLVALAGEAGMGLLTRDRGLNPARQIAAEAGLPEARIYRELDAAGENTATIRRYLDRAAFEAKRDGGVVVLGRSRPDTVTALFAWAAEPATGATPAPLSALLKEPGRAE